MEGIGGIKAIRRYPVKSMMGEDLAQARIQTSGLVGDRVYAFIDEQSNSKSFPWMGARQAPEFLLYRPRYISHFGKAIPDVIVSCPDGREFSVADKKFEAYLEAKYGYQITVKQDSNGCFGPRPISLLSVQTISQLEKETNLDRLERERFRANLYADWNNDRPFYEDELIGRTLQVGDRVEIKIVKRDSRCVIPTLDPKTAIPSPVVLEKIRMNHEGKTGVYAEVKQTGTVKLGDSIKLL